ncbi:hypothetical protein ABZ990_24600 [Streptomyces sp. NPDC046203]|uniref:hypothetical protein n=1 Tax=Streptomyces sp. NPDC046203 TaxID=3154602 RepID=UPI0033C400DE
MSGFLIEFRRTPVRWLALPLLLASAAMVFLVGGPWQGSWPETSAAATRAALPLTVAAVGIAAHRSSQLRRSGTDTLLAARRPFQVELARLAADAVWLCGVYLLCTGAAWIATATAGAPGGPWPEYVLFGISGIVFALALGHFTGRLLPTRFTGAIAAVGGFLLFTLVFGSQSSPLATLVFYHSIDVRLSATHLAWRLVATVLAVAAMGTVGGLIDRDTRRKGATAAGGFFSVATLICVLAMPGNGTELLERRPAEPAACAPGGGSTVCVWPEHAGRLDEAVDTARKIGAAADGVLPPPDRYRETGLARDGAGGFTLDHGRKDLLHTMLLELTDPHKTWCESGSESGSESEDANRRRMYAGLQVEAWLEARATGSGKLPDYTYAGDTGWQTDVRRVLALPDSGPDSGQVAAAKGWVREMRAPC